MLRQRRILAVLAMLALAGWAEGQDRATADGSRWTAQRVVAATSQERETVVSAYSDEGTSIAMGLRKVAEDPTLTNKERRDAIFLLGKFPSEDTVIFLLSAINLKLTVEHQVLERDQMFPCPARAALQEIGWSGVPMILRNVERCEKDEDMTEVGRVLVRIVGRESALQVVRAVPRSGRSSRIARVAALEAAIEAVR